MSRAPRLRLYAAAAVFGTALYSCESCSVLPAATASGTGYAASAVLALVSFFSLRFLWRRLHLAKDRAVAPMAWLIGILGGLAAIGTFLATRDAFIPLSEPDANGIAVADAPNHPEAMLFSFRDGRIDTTRFGRAVDEVKFCGAGESPCDSVTIVAPFVPDGWTPADPVPAWAVQTWNATDRALHHEPPSTWAFARTAGRRITPDALERRALADAASRYGLHSSPDAPVLIPSVDPTAEAIGTVRTAGVLVPGLLGAWWILLALAFGSTLASEPADTVSIAQPWSALVGLAVAPTLAVAFMALVTGEPGRLPLLVLSAIMLVVFWNELRPLQVRLDRAANAVRIRRPRPWGASVQRVARAEIQGVDIQPRETGYYGALSLDVVLVRRGDDAAISIIGKLARERDKLEVLAGAIRDLLGP